MADDGIGVHAVGAPQLGQRQLHADEHRLDPFDAGDLLALGDDLLQREPDLLDERGFDLGHRGGEGGLLDHQLAAHSQPLRALAGVDEHGAVPLATVLRFHHAGSGLAVGECAQSGDSAGVVARGDGGEPVVLRAPVGQRVGHLAQRYLLAGPGHPVGQRGGRGRDPGRRFPRHHQRRDRRCVAGFRRRGG